MKIVFVFATLITVCNALDIPWNPSIDKEDIVYFDQLPTLPESKRMNSRRASNNPQWLFFVSTEIVENNSTEPIMQWDLISHMTITPEQCGIITDVVAMLDDALQNANPEVKNMTSTALRIGNTNCTDEGECPCEKKQHLRRRVLFTRLLLEVRTRSPTPDLKPPLQFPLRVASFQALDSMES